MTTEMYGIAVDENTIKINTNGQVYVASVPPVDVAVMDPITNMNNAIGLAFDNSTITLNGSNELGINLANANTWTATQTFPIASFSNLLSTANTWTATQTFPSASIPQSALTGNIVDSLTATNGLSVSNPTGAGSASYSLILNGTTLSNGSSGLSLNLANANTWTAQQVFGSNASISSSVVTSALGYTPPRINTVTSTSQSVNTVYQNTNNYPIIVIVSGLFNEAGAGSVIGYVGSTNNPTTIEAQQTENSSFTYYGTPFELIIVVPSNWYYKISASNANIYNYVIIT